MKKRILAYLTIFNIGGGNNIQLNIVYLQSLTNSFKKLDVERKKWLIVADVDGRFPIEY